MAFGGGSMHIGMWLSLVEYLVRDEGAAGSNPVIPIKRNRLKRTI